MDVRDKVKALKARVEKLEKAVGSMAAIVLKDELAKKPKKKEAKNEASTQTNKSKRKTV